jgi:DNA replication and repair protein RecF
MCPDIEAVGNPDRGFGIRLLRLTNFRNYSSALVNLDPGFNVFSGPNGQGKTNLLEGLYLLSTSKLLRGSRDAEAVRQGEERAVVELEFASSGTNLGVILSPGIRKRALLNSMALPRAADLIGRLPCVCFSSADIPVVAGQPADRRMFLDMELSQLFPAYIRSLTVYKRALEQRNALLKSAQDQPQPPAIFESWENEIAVHGAHLRTFRSDFLQSLNPLAAGYHALLGEGEHLALDLRQSEPSETPEQLLFALARNRGQDIARGSTTSGPHRDELLVSIDGREARLYGSQGQQRTAIIAIKLAVLQLATQRHGMTRRSKLIEIVLESAGQVVLTCTEREQAGEEIAGRARHFEVRAGTVQLT